MKACCLHFTPKSLLHLILLPVSGGREQAMIYSLYYQSLPGIAGTCVSNGYNAITQVTF